MKSFREYLEDLEYVGSHKAPNKASEDAPLYDLERMFPDIYTSKALQYYGTGESYDSISISIIQSVKDRPKAQVKIYRTVPDMNKEIATRIKKLKTYAPYFNKFRFLPINDKTIQDLTDKYYDDKKGYVKNYESLVLSDIENMIVELEKHLKPKLTFNVGDWVTTCKQYAIDHGKNHLNNKYKLLTKTVPAKHIYSDGNSIHEYGYDPT